MTVSASAGYDVAVVGAGPVGSLCALAHARNGARVALLEANPKASHRLAGEWLHPPAVRMLHDLGIALDGCPNSSTCSGFAVFPEDGSESILLPYPGGATGVAYEHGALVGELHAALEDEAGVDFVRGGRVRAVEDGRLSYALNGTEKSLAAGRVIGADGRASVVRRSLGLSPQRATCSRMIGLVAEGVSLPQEGYGHVVLGGPGPILMFKLGAHRVRVIVDVPLDHWLPRDRVAMLLESYARLLPDPVRSAFVNTLQRGNFQAAANELQPRITYGTPRRVLIGDAAGHYHPLTAVGMALGFDDAMAIARNGDFRRFVASRRQATRAPEFLALGLYEIFADHRIEAVAMRQAVYRRWRASPAVRDRTTRLLACEDASVTRLGLTFLAIAVDAVFSVFRHSLNWPAWRRAGGMARALGGRVGHFLRGYRQLHEAEGTSRESHERVWGRLPQALLTSMKAQNGDARPAFPTVAIDARETLERATKRLLGLQREDGCWEGEMVWCPMLTAQYVLQHHIVGLKVEPARRRRLLRQFERTRLSEGLWGLHEHARPYLFVTALVYVAARLLGTDREDPLIARAGQFLRSEGVLAIPSWGKFWLALLNLYDWRGLNPVLPELWLLPSRMPLHPSNWYCHTRLIYLAMAAVYAHRFQAPVTPLVEALREELFPEGFESVDFAAGRHRLREGDLFARPTIWLRAVYAVGRVYERLHSRRLRRRCVKALVGRIRWELASSSHTSISPVSGFLNILALWLDDPDDSDCRKALAQADGWIWEDEDGGTRVTGARSASWDTGFALQAMATVRKLPGVPDALETGSDFLRSQQIRESFDGYRAAYRNDPKGGWCFAGVWHGWPVTDCTAEAVLGMLAVRPETSDPQALREAIAFMLRGQNRDGGFGSYEARRSRFGLEWLNPAEMFGESMTERSYVECTASCLAALAACRRHFPDIVDGTAARAMQRGDAWLRRSQSSDGAWRGVWGVQFIYGTFFGIRGLVATGAGPGDPALRLACRWLLDHQRADGGWGEHHSGCLSGRYVPHTESQVIQTAWALIALLEAGDSNWAAIARGAQFLIDTQNPDGTWPRQDMAGVFFRTALLDYVLYRQYFPLHALGLYENRRRTRHDAAKAQPSALAATA